MMNWIAAFVMIAAAAIVLQVLVLVAMYIQMRQANARMTRIATDLETRVSPILSRLDRLLEDSQGRLSSVVADSAEIVHLARSQAQKFDRVFSEAVDRLRLQIIRADQLVTGALEAVENGGSRIRRAVWGPMHEVSALIQGVKTGLDFFRNRRPAERGREQQDEGLFI